MPLLYLVTLSDAPFLGGGLRWPNGPWPGEKTPYFPAKTGHMARHGIWPSDRVLSSLGRVGQTLPWPSCVGGRAPARNIRLTAWETGSVFEKPPEQEQGKDAKHGVCRPELQRRHEASVLGQVGAAQLDRVVNEDN